MSKVITSSDPAISGFDSIRVTDPIEKGSGTFVNMDFVGGSNGVRCTDLTLEQAYALRDALPERPQTPEQPWIVSTRHPDDSSFFAEFIVPIEIESAQDYLDAAQQRADKLLDATEVDYLVTGPGVRRGGIVVLSEDVDA